MVIKMKVKLKDAKTIFETGLINHLRSGRYDFIDRYVDGLTPEDIKEIYRKSF